MTYVITTEADLENWNLEDLETFLKADAFNAECQPRFEPIINPALGLELIYAPIGFTCGG
ncbi:hypothetical protein [Nonomuraea endophytica]|uniref:Uncharacterized protein n=1 Tax=Nonomuraea endophytica TaxID=714136 RepID=A0A7W8A1P8_9ACTN|nr:hypothetical protein [Nonomuraea endophytica]MBB5077962.1 hypothetical protein [Nonomuraea endophytica]